MSTYEQPQLSSARRHGSCMNSAKRRYLLLASALVALAWPKAARAESEFPSRIESDLGLSYQVPCSVCHLKENTGAATARTPFALSLKARDFTDGGSLSAALARLKADDFDSDGDGVSDVAELQAGTDPNSAANASIINDEEPGYGCGGSAPHGRSMGQALLGAAVFGWLLTRRLRGRP